MRLLVLRHGEAESFAVSDADRNLTERGRQDVQRVIGQCGDALQKTARIVASPYRRAQQTAKLVADSLGLTVETLPLITPEANLNEVLAWLNKQVTSKSSGQILLVSHQPLIGSLVDGLCGLPYGRLVMGTSALAAIEAEVFERNCADLLWHQFP